MEYIYIVFEDNHGDVSYWTTEEGAQSEVERIINEMYGGDMDVEDELVGYRAEAVDRPW